MGAIFCSQVKGAWRPRVSRGCTDLPGSARFCIRGCVTTSTRQGFCFATLRTSVPPNPALCQWSRLVFRFFGAAHSGAEILLLWIDLLHQPIDLGQDVEKTTPNRHQTRRQNVFRSVSCSTTCDCRISKPSVRKNTLIFYFAMCRVLCRVSSTRIAFGTNTRPCVMFYQFVKRWPDCCRDLWDSQSPGSGEAKHNLQVDE